MARAASLCNIPGVCTGGCAQSSWWCPLFPVGQGELSEGGLEHLKLKGNLKVRKFFHSFPVKSQLQRGTQSTQGTPIISPQTQIISPITSPTLRCVCITSISIIFPPGTAAQVFFWHTSTRAQILLFIGK